MKQSKLPKQTLIILGIALVLVISTVMWSSAQITQDTEEEVQSTLRDVATQNALIVQQEIRENFNLLYSLADAISVSRVQPMPAPLPHSWNLSSPPMGLSGLASSHRMVRQWPLTAMYKICPAEIFSKMVCRGFPVLPILFRIEWVLRSPSMYSAFPYMIRVIPLSVFYLPPIGTSILKKF